jgi:hypothetical protein
VAKSGLLENAIDSQMRIKATTYSDVQQKPCQFYWHGILRVTIVTQDPLSQRKSIFRSLLGIIKVVLRNNHGVLGDT